VIDVYDETGKRRLKWVSGFATKTEARNAYIAAKNTLNQGGDPFPAEITYAEFVERWLKHLETQAKPRPATRERYGRLLELWVIPTLGPTRIDRIGVPHVQHVLDEMTRAGKAPRTVAHVRAAISAVFTYAMRQQLVAQNPVRATETPTPTRPDLRIPTAEELMHLVETARGTAWEKSRS
jgi:site-specific recombinase XerD